MFFIRLFLVFTLYSLVKGTIIRQSVKIADEKKPTDNPLATIPTLSLIQCTLGCSSTEGCESFAFGENICIMHTTAYEENDEELGQASGFKYYALKKFPALPRPTAMPTTPARTTMLSETTTKTDLNDEDISTTSIAKITTSAVVKTTPVPTTNIANSTDTTIPTTTTTPPTSTTTPPTTTPPISTGILTTTSRPSITISAEETTTTEEITTTDEEQNYNYSVSMSLMESDPMNYDDAVQFCKDNSMSIVEINKYVQSMINDNSFTGGAWIGLTYSGHGDNFKWERSGNSINADTKGKKGNFDSEYHNWADGEPSNYKGTTNTIAVMAMGDGDHLGEWKTRDKNDPLPFIICIQ